MRRRYRFGIFLTSFANMYDRIEEHFGSLTVEISRLSAELKEEVEAIKTNLKSVEQSLQSAWDYINDLQEESKTHSEREEVKHWICTKKK